MYNQFPLGFKPYEEYLITTFVQANYKLKSVIYERRISRFANEDDNDWMALVDRGQMTDDGFTAANDNKKITSS